MNFKYFDVNDEIFNNILRDFEADVVKLDKLEDKSYYDQRNKVIYIDDGNTKKILCQAYRLNYYLDDPIYTGWKQIILNLREYADAKAETSVDGQHAWQYMYSILSKKYSKKEIRAILTSYQTKEEYDKQYHYDWPIVSQNVQKLTNCVKYDINGAHTDALSEMFPRCKADFLWIYKKRHTDIRYKKYPNFFVGMMKRKGYVGAYWHIVERTTKILIEAINKVGGQLVYANTDGFCVQNPEHLLNTSDNLGEFKLEFQGDAYVFVNEIKSPYILYQFGDKLVGSCLTAVRNDIDLSKGNVVYYDRVKCGESIQPENIIKETICVESM